MLSISASSQRMSDIVSGIDGIAFRTNSLALNASVEAARAGKQRRGFRLDGLRQLRGPAGAGADTQRFVAGFPGELNRRQGGDRCPRESLETDKARVVCRTAAPVLSICYRLNPDDFFYRFI